MGGGSDDSLGVIAMGVHVDRFDDTDIVVLDGVRFHSLQREEGSRADTDRRTKESDECQREKRETDLDGFGDYG